jgi:hypothetical protein
MLHVYAHGGTCARVVRARTRKDARSTRSTRSTAHAPHTPFLLTKRIQNEYKTNTKQTQTKTKTKQKQNKSKQNKTKTKQTCEVPYRASNERARAWKPYHFCSDINNFFFFFSFQQA